VVTLLPQAWATVWEQRTLAIFPRRLAWCGLQHNGVAAAKMAARV
jgi:hypothetical protein